MESLRETDDILMNSRSRMCPNTGAVTANQFFASGMVVGSTNCSINAEVVTVPGMFGCGTTNQSGYRQLGNGTLIAGCAANAYGTCGSLPSTWKCPSGSFDRTTIFQSGSDGGGVLCCRQRKTVCKDCIDSSCSILIHPRISAVTPSKGPTSGGYTITITGVYFGSIGDVLMNGVVFRD